MSGTIALLVAESLTLEAQARYRIFHVARLWERMGFTVRIHRGKAGPVEADLYIPHVDLSVQPAWLRELIEHKSLVVNKQVKDIRRTAFSENLLTETDAYDGPVLVKSNANYGGLPEVRARLGLKGMPGLLDRSRVLLWSIRRKIAMRTLSQLATAEFLEPKNYRVFPRLGEVPRGVFRNDQLVVEKFLPEREGPHYVLRTYSFFGSGGFAIRTRSERPIVKGRSGFAPEFVEPHEDIVAARRELHFDYGKFDYAIHDGRAVLFDVNPTPTFGPVFAGKLGQEMAARLATGIEQWFPRESPTRIP